MKHKRRNPLPGIILIVMLSVISGYIVFLRVSYSEPMHVLKKLDFGQTHTGYISGPALAKSDGTPYVVPDTCVSLCEELGIYRLSEDMFSENSVLFSVGPYLYVLSPGTEHSILTCYNVCGGSKVLNDYLPSLNAQQKGTEWFCGTMSDGAFWLGTSNSSDRTKISIFSPEENCKEVFSIEKSFRASFICITPYTNEIVMLSGRDFICADLVNGQESSCHAPEETIIPEMLFMSSEGVLYGCSTNGTDISTVQPKDWRITPIGCGADVSVFSRDYCTAMSFESSSMTLIPFAFPESSYVLLGESTNSLRGHGQCAVDGNIMVIIDPYTAAKNYGRRVYDLATGHMVQYIQYGDFENAFSCCRSIVCSDEFGWCAYFDPFGKIQIFSLDSEIYKLADKGLSASFPDTECGRLAKEIYQKTGVQVHWGKGGNLFNVKSFAAEHSDDIHSLNTMICLRDFLCSMPEKMVTEMLIGTADELHIYLCTNVRTVPDLGFGVGGFTELNDDRFTVVFDLQDDFWTEGNIAHEFWHVMEYRMNKLEELTGRPFLSGWMTIMPEELCAMYLEYGSESISNEWLGSEKYTADGETDDSRIWFVRSYSVSDPSEDRATVFETINWSERRYLVQNCTHLKEKAGYVCSLIRACFPSCAASDSLSWEKKLGGEIPTWFFDTKGVNRIQ